MKILLKKNGFSLVSTLIAMGISVAIALQIAKIMNSASKASVKVKSDTELLDFRNFLKSNFTRGQNCRNTFMQYPINYKGNAGGKGNNQDTSTPLPFEAPSSTRFYRIAKSGNRVSDVFRLVTNTNPDPNLNAPTTSSITFTAGEPLRMAPNWILDEVRIYRITNNPASDPNTGICNVRFEVSRKGGSKRSIGAENTGMWVSLNCSLNTSSTPANKMAFCVDNQAIYPGFWSYDVATDPTSGIRYDGDVFIGRHLTIESDKRIKKDFHKINSASKKLEQLDGFYYFMDRDKYPYKNYSKRRQLGLIAQDVESVFPEAINTNSEGIKSVSYSMLIPVLIEAHKEQVKIIKKQEKRIKQLERKIMDEPYRK